MENVENHGFGESWVAISEWDIAVSGGYMETICELVFLFGGARTDFFFVSFSGLVFGLLETMVDLVMEGTTDSVWPYT